MSRQSTFDYTYKSAEEFAADAKVGFKKAGGIEQAYAWFCRGEYDQTYRKGRQALERALLDHVKKNRKDLIREVEKNLDAQLSKKA